MTNRTPFVNGWLTFVLVLLFVIYCTTGIAALKDGDSVTIFVLAGVTVLAIVARGYQYFVQKR